MNPTPFNADARTDHPPPDSTGGGAAFFGLDQTLIPGSSLFVLARGLHQRGFYTTADLLRFAWLRLLFTAGWRKDAQLETSTDAALAFVEGRHRPEMRALAKEIADERILPQVYPDVARLIERHRSSGARTFIATAASSELAEVVAHGLGMTGALGTSAEVDEAERYSGRLGGSVLHGTAKAVAVETHAAASGIDLTTSTAYSDSINDLPLLELVGRPEVVNPDRKLRRVASERNWPVHDVEPGPSRPAEPDVTCVADRLAALGIESHVWPAGKETVPTGPHTFSVDDPDELMRTLEGSGRFRRDSRLGSLFHRGKVSLREVSPTHSLHITVGDENKVSAHVDRFSPLARIQRHDGVRYSFARVAAHNVTGMAADLARLVTRRRHRHVCDPEPKVRPTRREPAGAPGSAGTEHGRPVATHADHGPVVLSGDIGQWPVE